MGRCLLKVNNKDKGGCFYISIIDFEWFNYQWVVEPFHATDFFLYPWKNLWFSDVFKGYRKRPVVWKGLRHVENGEIGHIISVPDCGYLDLIGAILLENLQIYGSCSNK